MIEVLHPGLLSSLQDSGRPGHAHLGIGRAGAADAAALVLANTLVGNAADACAIEATLAGPRLLMRHSTWISLTGAPLPRATLDGEALPMWRPVHAEAGSELVLGPMTAGCRSYLAVAGGIAVEPWLGSRATDLNAGLGPFGGRALRSGDVLPLGTPAGTLRYDGHWSLDPSPWFDDEQQAPLRLLPGSHTGLLDDAGRQALDGRVEARVGSESNRVGVRLDWPDPLRLGETSDVLSEGLVPGTMQLPPGGQPILMLVEHPVTGGYPRIAHLAATDLSRLAQRRPGATVRFRWIDMPEARLLAAKRQRELGQLCVSIRARLEEGT